MTKPKIIFFDIDGTLVPLKEGSASPPAALPWKCRSSKGSLSMRS